MKITFAIPFYSTPEFLDDAVRSVLAQTYEDWTLIVVDDRSPHPAIPEQLQAYGDKRIQYHLNEKNLGQGGNWNECLKLAETELVTLLHADDMLHPNYAQAMVDAAQKIPDASAFFCNADIVDGDGKKVFSFADFYKKFLIPSGTSSYVVEGEEGLSALIRGNFIMCPTLCYRKNLLGEVRFSPEWKCAPDLEFMSRHLIAGGKVVGLPITAFSYRRHEESGTAIFRKNMQQFLEEIRLYDLIAERSDAVGWRKAAEKARSKGIVKLRLLYFALKDLLKGRFKMGSDKLKVLFRLLAGLPEPTQALS